MYAQDLLDHFRRIGHWVLWDLTEDHFLHGDANVLVDGIAVAWCPTNHALRQARALGCNLFVTHEPAFYPGFEGTGSGEFWCQAKRGLLDELGLTLLRCHDTWDRMPGLGVVDAWADWLGFAADPRPVEAFYRLCHVDNWEVDRVAAHVLERTRPLGQSAVFVLGEGHRRVRRLAVGTGAITFFPAMEALQANAILATEDGMNFWTGGLWAVDSGVPLIIVNHATSEKPGIQSLARYLAETFPTVPVHYLDVPLAPRAVVAAP